MDTIGGKEVVNREQPSQNSSGSARRAVVTTQKRGREEIRNDYDNDTKRFKKTIGSIAEVYICPITSALPADPVLAEDGRVYERSAIEKYMKTHGQEQELKSPVTNDPMGPRLLPAVQVRNSIRLLLGSGAIEGQLERQLKQETKEEAVVGEMKEKAEEGNAMAMCKLGVWYREGMNGLPKDNTIAYQWFQKAADLQHPVGMGYAGVMLLNGVGVQKSTANGLILVATAAGLGYDVAAYTLGLWCYEGKDGTTKDSAQAKYWLSKAVDGSCSIKRISEVNRKKALAYLSELGNN